MKIAAPKSRISSRRWNGPLGALGLTACLLLQQFSLPAILAQTLSANSSKASTASQVPIKGQISIQRDVKVAPDNATISLSLRDASLRDVLNMIAKQGNFNVVLDESVEGTLTIDVNNISVNKALEYIFTISDLSYSRDGNTVIIATNAVAGTKNLNAHTFKAIPVLYKDAALIATQLNTTLFSVSRPGGSNRAIAASDANTNSLLIMGTDADIKLAGDALRELDVPRNRKVYQIRYNDPMYVAQVLAANFFGFGGAAGGVQGGAAGGVQGGAAGGAQGGAAGGAQGGAAGGVQQGGAAGGVQQGAAGGVQQGGAAGGGANGGLVLASGGVTFIAEPISSTLTVMGTDEQIALIDSLIHNVDIRRPQVSIEMSLVELQNSDIKRLIPTWGNLNLGQWNLSLLPTAPGLNRLNWTGGGNPANIPRLASFNLQSELNKIKGRILANPNVVALDGTSSSIEITDEVPTITQTTTITNNNPVITTTITKEKAGITLNVTPRVTNDGSITLNLTPSVSQPLREVSANDVSTFLISERKLNLGSVRVLDGQTLVIGGLLRESQSSDIRETPGISKLPIVGAMFRATNANRKDRTELVLMVTPHILKEEATSYTPTPVNSGVNGGYMNPNQGGIQPIALPKYLGATPSEVPSPSSNEQSSAKPNGENGKEAYAAMAVQQEKRGKKDLRGGTGAKNKLKVKAPAQASAEIPNLDSIEEILK